MKLRLLIEWNGKAPGKVVERPQHMYMRVALWITKSFEEAVEYYTALSERVRYIAACLALGETPDDGGQPAIIDAPQPVAPGGQPVTLEALMN